MVAGSPRALRRLPRPTRAAPPARMRRRRAVLGARRPAEHFRRRPRQPLHRLLRCPTLAAQCPRPRPLGKAMSEPTVPAAPHNAALEFKVPGAVDISERLPDEGCGSYKSVQLLEAEDAEDIGLEIGHCTDPEIREVLGYFVGLSVYHQHDPETDRVFHSRMSVRLTRGEMVRLRDFLEFLLRPPQ